LGQVVDVVGYYSSTTASPSAIVVSAAVAIQFGLTVCKYLRFT